MTYTESAARRRDARDAAHRATLTWVDTVLTQLAELADSIEVTGDSRAIVFESGVEHNDYEHDHWREELRAVTFASLETEVMLTHADADDEHWAEAVALWIELRDALGVFNGNETPPGILVDVDKRAVGCWESYYCPDLGPLPSQVQILPTVESLDAEPQDPFTALLAADDHTDGEDALVAMDHMLGLHELVPPTVPGHAPGECEIDEVDTP